MSEQTESQYHKTLVMVMRKLGIVEMLITDDDIRPLIAAEPDMQACIILNQAPDGLHVILSDVATAKVIAELATEPPLIERLN